MWSRRNRSTPGRATPFTAQVREGNLYGRGACDMKGGIAAMVFAVEALSASGIELRGDVIVATNTDEESSGAGGTALVQRGLAADAGIVTEPTNFNVWIACRGSDYAVIRIQAAPATPKSTSPTGERVELSTRSRKQPWSSTRSRRCANTGAGSPACAIQYLSAPTLLPTMARSGEWPVTYPAQCELTIVVVFVPQQADEQRLGNARQARGGAVDRERVGRKDDWLAAHPPTFDWWPNSVMPLEIPSSEPVVQTTLAATADIGRAGD